MTSLAEQLREMNEKVTSKKFAIVMLGSLPDSWDNFLTSMNVRDADNLDWENVKGVLVEEFMKRREKAGLSLEKNLVGGDKLTEISQKWHENERISKNC